MQQPNPTPNPASSGLLGVRISVWFIMGGLLVMCVLLIIKSHRDERSPNAEAAFPREDVTVRGLSHTGSDARRIHRIPLPRTVSETDAQGASSQTSAAISSELTGVQEELTKLRRDYSDENPTVKGLMRALESLQRSAQTPGETLELAQARADLAKLEVRFDPQNPTLEGQRRFVESLEQSAAVGESSDLAQAKAQLAKLRVSYMDRHPEVQSQLKAIAELQQ